MTINHSTIILYNGGAYGTFVEWCLNYFSGTIHELPFTRSGSSHKFTGHRVEARSLRDQSANVFQFFRMHPKTKQNPEPIARVLEYTTSHYANTILLHPTYNSVIFNLNNIFEKIWDDWFAFSGPHYQVLSQRWSQNFELWEKREYLSLTMYKNLVSYEVELNVTLSYSCPTLLKIPIENLVDNFTNTILSLFDHLKITPIRNNFDEISDIWVPLQKHKDKDSIVKHIVEAIVNNTEISWTNKNLTLVDEAMIQMFLRDDHNLHLKCYKLNSFPTSTSEIRDLLYHK